jgi:hypothetical protein
MHKLGYGPEGEVLFLAAAPRSRRRRGMPGIWTSQGNSSTGRPGSVAADALSALCHSVPAPGR